MSEERKTVKTLSEIMELPARESMPIVARVAPAINEIVEQTGVLKLLFNNTVAVAGNPRAMAKLSEKEQAKIRARMVGIGEQVISVVLKSLGDCMPQYVEILAAINGMTSEELLDNYSMKELVNMVKALVSDTGFLSSVQTLTK